MLGNTKQPKAKSTDEFSLPCHTFTLALKVVILMHWSLAGSFKDEQHLADDTGSFKTTLKIFHQQERKGKKCPLAHSVATIGLLTFGYLNKLPDGKKGAWILIPSYCGKVNEGGASWKAERCSITGLLWLSLHTLSPRQGISYCLGEDRLCLLCQRTNISRSHRHYGCLAIHPILVTF